MTTFHVGGIGTGPRPPDVSLSLISRVDEEFRRHFEGCPSYFKSFSVGLKVGGGDFNLNVFVSIETTRIIEGKEQTLVRGIIQKVLRDSISPCGYHHHLMIRYHRPYKPTLEDDLDYLAGLTESGP